MEEPCGEFPIENQEAICEEVGANSACLHNLSCLQKSSSDRSFIFGHVHNVDKSVINPSFWANFSLLTIVNLSGKHITDCDFLQHLPAIARLNLAENQLKAINGLLYCKQIEFADFSYNNIQHLPPLESLVFLKEINLNHNCIKSIEGVWGCGRLNSLSLTHNLLTAVALLGLDLNQIVYGSVGYLDQLENVYTQMQKEHFMPVRPPLLGLPMLRFLDLSYNEGLSSAVSLKLTVEQCVELQQQYDLIECAGNVSHGGMTFVNYAQKNGQGVFPDTISELHLAGCGISLIGGLANLHLINVLSLKENQIIDSSNLCVLQPLRLLRRLDLSQNPIREQNLYRSQVVSLLDQLSVLDGEEITVAEKIRVNEYFNPSLKQKASQDHRVNILHQFTRPQQLRDCTLQSPNSPYPILALIGPTAANKGELCRRLVDEFGQFFVHLKCHTDKPWRLSGITTTNTSSLHPFNGYLPQNKNVKTTSYEELTEDEHYYYVDTQEFEKKRARGEFIQTVSLFGYQYGLTWASLDNVARKGLAGVFTGEVEAMFSFRLSDLQPRYILCLPEDIDAHEQRLRKRFTLDLQEFHCQRGQESCCVERAFEHIESNIKWCLDRTKTLYPDTQRNYPEAFDGVLQTDDVEQSYRQLSLLVADYLGVPAPWQPKTSDFTDGRAFKPVSSTLQE
ncbi:hypothetical protein PHET_06970 [Paragonimus heterotremus]|uniref:Guanylate kinase-like domain-containing protein n=1 Tax=Paragonimus heterotremus TaxID=100268 RepID=A0A8J4T8G6_9TREM|nr:hypothetical protein PHET_06970 [Paragonimus heterotremus]